MTPTKTTTKPAQMTETRTLRVTRVIKAPAERVYNAFLDPDAMAKWSPPNGYTGHVYKMEPKEGGTWRMSFSSLDRKQTHFFGGKYLELKPYERIRYTDNFEDPALQTGTDLTVTVTFKPVKGGTEVTVVQEGLPAAIPLDDAEKGWGQSFDNLSRLVEQ